MKKIFDDFTHCYSLSKTLRFRLIPQLKTSENIKKYNIISDGEKRSNNYQDVKPLFDRCHRQFIDLSLKDFEYDWKPLYNALLSFRKDRSDKSKEMLQNEQKECQKAISSYIKRCPEYKKLEPKTIIDDLSKGENFFGLSDEEKDKIKDFKGFSTYFQGYKEVRENIYSEKAFVSVAYRSVMENFPKFADNITRYLSLPHEIKNNLNSALKDLLCGYHLDEIFSVGFFNEVLTQKGIDFYNNILGGFNYNDNVKIQGINEYLNLLFQQKKLEKKTKFTPLFKQILSDRIKVSFLPEQFSSYEELAAALKEYSVLLCGTLEKANTASNLFNNDDIDTTKIYIPQNEISFLSQLLFDNNWQMLHEKMQEAGLKKASEYTLYEVQGVCGMNILSIISNAFAAACKEILSAQKTTLFSINTSPDPCYNEIKAYLDKVQEAEKLLKIFAVSGELEKDAAFYTEFDELYSPFRENIPLYNKVRNFATKKEYSTEKFKLSFECPTLANGWDVSKERENNCIILLRDGHFYLGIYNAKNKNRIPESNHASERCYRKMVYNLLPGPNKMLPKVFFSEKGLKIYNPSKYILDGYKAGKHKKGENFDLKFCHDLIDFFKESIALNSKWTEFGFKFSDTSEYRDISGFYKEIEAQNYNMSFSYVTNEDADNFVREGKMFLFEIYNKDFSPSSTGRKNLHTLYWQQLFSAENLTKPVYKLNGQAELFYRPASINNPFVHKKGSVLIKKCGKDGLPVDEALYQAAYKDSENGMGIDELKEKYNGLSFRTAPHDIIKDKRYSEDVFSFHVPITINYGIQPKYKKFNEAVLKALKENKDVNIIGIDRGERNLIYLSCIDQKGNIIEQKSFNTINGTDYHEKLTQIEKQRNEARKNWKAIGKIKDLKAGYLSLVVHEIIKMMIKYNAILVMEDLNFGFKRGRFHIEKQVYQNFEKMLIDKLNYYVDKNFSDNEPGGILNAYQLTDEFKSFQTLGKQSGFLFYVPAGYTSKIDPASGFVNLFTSKQLRYQSVEASRQFIKAFDFISYDSENHYFKFTFKYSSFNLNKKDFQNEWTVCTAGSERIVHTNKNGYDTTKKINVTEELLKLLENYGIDIAAPDLKDALCTAEDTKFYKTLIWLFGATVQLRYENKEEDYILSPVKTTNGFFDSRKQEKNMPKDGDANGAYHIALRGLRLITERIKDGKILNDKKGEQNYNWFSFVQKKEYKN